MSELNSYSDARFGDDFKGQGNGSVADYLHKASQARDMGDSLLGMYLYLAAFEKSTQGGKTPTEDALLGIKQAWADACVSKERSLAEYIFEKMEPYLSSDELGICSNALQELALDRLEECGVSREDLEEMASMIAEDLLGDSDATFKIEKVSTQKVPGGIINVAEIKGSAAPASPLFDLVNSLPSLSEAASAKSKQGADQKSEPKPQGILIEGTNEILTFSNIAGYAGVIKDMEKLGFTREKDEDYLSLVEMLNARHGLAEKPSLDTVLFRSAVREDANRFVMATIGELGLPAVHMRMEENVQGLPVLCISTRAESVTKQNSLQDVFKNGGILILEDLDMWTSPSFDCQEDGPAFIMMQLTRGAREAVDLIRSSVENPHVYVFATMASEGEIDPFFLDALEPISVVDIELPTAEERVNIWMDIMKRHPSLRSINKAELVRLTANMPRFDIYMAAREAVEDAYKAGISQKKYVPVTRDNLYDKLAAYQPLESREYTDLENAVLADFKVDLENLEDLLNEEGK